MVCYANSFCILIFYPGGYDKLDSGTLPVHQEADGPVTTTDFAQNVTIVKDLSDRIYPDLIKTIWTQRYSFQTEIN